MEYYAISDRGLIRAENQDSYIVATNKNKDVCLIVCDGIGGANSGKLASEVAVKSFGEEFSKSKRFKNFESAQTWARETVLKINDLVFSESTTEKSKEGMGTTFVAAFVLEVGNFILNIGDSRAYGLNHEDELVLLTKDHNLASELFFSGEISKEEVLQHPKRNVLTNALGIISNLKIDIFEFGNEYSQLLLCSDGLHGYVYEDSIKKVMRQKLLPLQDKAKELVSLANKVGGYDNVTVLLIDFLRGKE